MMRQPHRAYMGPAWRNLGAATPETLVSACEAMARRASAGGRLRPLLGRVLAFADDRQDVNGAYFVRALARWARQVSHVREPIAIGEMVMPPEVVIRENWGDCDDVATAVCAIAATVEVPCRLRWFATGPASAHMVAVVRPGWYADGGRDVVIDQLQDTDALTVGL